MILSNVNEIKQVKNDIARLTALLHEDDKLSNLAVSNSVKLDMNQFIETLSLTIDTIPQNEDIQLSKDEIFEALRIFLTE